MFVLILLFVWISILRCSRAGCADEPAASLADITRRSPNDYWTGGSLISDHGLTSGWYNLVSNGWQYFMTDSTEMPDYTQCGTYWPIYLNAQHPSYDSITETPMTFKACARDYLYPCDIWYEIKIRKCGDDVHYYLKDTIYYSAYCFAKHKQLQQIIPAPTNVNLGTITVKPELHFQRTNFTFPFPHSQYRPFFKFRCSFNVQGNYFYTISWYFDNKVITTLGPTQDQNKLTVEEDYLINESITLPGNFKCDVSVSADEKGEKTEPVLSGSFYAGMTILNDTISLVKGESAYVLMKSTLPIGCLYTTLTNYRQSCKNTGALQMIVNENSDWNCQKMEQKGGITSRTTLQTSSDQCASGFETLTTDDTWDPNKLHKFKIVTADMNYNDLTIYNLKFGFGNNMPHRILKNIKFPIVRVKVTDDRKYQQRICYSHVDPHMRTGDNYYYEQQRLGTYLLYENTEYGIEVQERTTMCNSNYARCTCGVIVRAGRDAFMINQCGTLNYFDFIRCDDGGILQVQRQHDRLYNIYTPIGTKITVEIHGPGTYHRTMNVDITMAPKDMGKVRGLCGNVDGNVHNDLLHSDGRLSTLNSGTSRNEYYSFSDSWSLLSPTLVQKNLFDSHKRNLNSWQDQNGLYCVCRENKNTGKPEAMCSPSQYLDCKLSRSVTEKKCSVLYRRRKRSMAGHDKELERLYRLMEPDITDTQLRVKRQDDPNAITPEQAKQLCTSKINGSLAVKSYGEVSGNEDPDAVIDQCAYDVEVGDDITAADVHVEAVNNIVKNMMDKEPEYVQNNTEKVEVFLINTCPGNCSNNGNCTKLGECKCVQYFHGPDCKIDERDPLEVDDIEGGGECDLADGGDCACFKVRSENILESVQCAASITKIFINDTQQTVGYDNFEGGYEDMFTAECCVPKNIAGESDVFVAKYGVTISNNGVNQSNVADVYVFDSTCQNVSSETNGTKTFTVKEDFCFVEGHCAQDGDMAAKGCLACKSSVNVFNWTVHNPCENGGTCTSTNTGYACACVPGYEGVDCQRETDECLSSPCKNGGTCVDKFNGFICSCAAGYTGSTCEIDLDECASQPCINGASCQDLVNAFSCTCAAGYTGNLCETDIDDCASNTCKEPNVCKDGINTFKCECADGFTGTDCTKEIDECKSDPCENGATCTDQVNGYNCTCLPGYNGSLCENDIDECASNPCENGATCMDMVDGYTCTCVSGYSGSRCEIDIDECASSPCENGATCRDHENRYTCLCSPGYNGTRCETEIDECQYSPCENGATCFDHVNAYSCACLPGYNGSQCEIDIDECASVSCENGATCADHINSYTCTCAAGYTGIRCETDIDECFSSPCENGGTCRDEVNRYTCVCVQGYFGTKCETDVDDCASSPCANNGTCTDQVNGYKCTCLPGYTGVLCEIDIDECNSSPCVNGATCSNLVNGYMCTCLPGFNGIRCETEIDECAPRPCENGATCTDQVNGYTCACLPGYNGTRCEAEINECLSAPCQNGGSCQDEINRYTCKCVNGFVGQNCEIDFDECNSNPCMNGASCMDQVNGYMCTCLPGYNGTHCEIETDECLSDPCQNGGTCQDEINRYTCKCVSGFVGQNCEIDYDECNSNPCMSGASCMDQVNGYMCNCLPGYNGSRCEFDVNECESNPCQNGGTCTDRVNGYICTCVTGYYGTNCESDIDYCESSPCMNGATCTDLLHGYLCLCLPGYSGTVCETDINECASNPCQNGGTCTDRVNGYTCTCATGYYGTNCESDKDYCESSPCMNGATCMDLVLGYTCLCLPGYTGTDCELDIDECASSPCENGGACTDHVNGYMCTCLPGYNGTRCGTDIDDCASSPCENGGDCSDRVDGFICTCMPGYEGSNCETEMDECQSSPCKNNATCVDDVNMYTCSCQPGYNGTNCEIDFDDCASSPCENGASCTDHVNGFTCSCSSGYQGDNCESSAEFQQSMPLVTVATATSVSVVFLSLLILLAVFFMRRKRGGHSFHTTIRQKLNYEDFGTQKPEKEGKNIAETSLGSFQDQPASARQSSDSRSFTDKQAAKFSTLLAEEANNDEPKEAEITSKRSSKTNAEDVKKGFDNPLYSHGQTTIDVEDEQGN